MSQEHQKTLFVAIAGRPNVGKSTILNAILGDKLSIVSPKPQTTRNSIKGIITKDNYQIVFVDTPGILETPKGNLHNVILKNAWNALKDIDMVCFVIDGRKKITREDIDLARDIQKYCDNVVCIINKTDAIKNQANKYSNAQELYQTGLFLDIFPVSATKKHGIENLLNYIIKHAKPQPWHYEADDITDRPNSFIASEITRETIFYEMYDEIPYNINVETHIFRFLDDGIQISQDIVVAREAHKKMVIGQHGQNIKAIREDSTKKMSAFFAQKVDLSLFVKVKPAWINFLSPDD